MPKRQSTMYSKMSIGPSISIVKQMTWDATARTPDTHTQPNPASDPTAKNKQQQKPGRRRSRSRGGSRPQIVGDHWAVHEARGMRQSRHWRARTNRRDGEHRVQNDRRDENVPRHLRIVDAVPTPRHTRASVCGRDRGAGGGRGGPTRIRCLPVSLYCPRSWQPLTDSGARAQE